MALYCSKRLKTAILSPLYFNPSSLIRRKSHRIKSRKGGENFKKGVHPSRQGVQVVDTLALIPGAIQIAPKIFVFVP